VFDLGESSGEALVDGIGRRCLRRTLFADFERESVGALSEFECDAGKVTTRRGKIAQRQAKRMSFDPFRRRCNPNSSPCPV
jgi:hypothetical protein